MPTLQGMVYDANGDPAVGRVVRVYRRDTGTLIGETETSDGTPIPGDSDYPNVSLLLHMDGANNDTTFVDSSPNGHSSSALGTGALKTAGAKFGTTGFSSVGGGAMSVPSSSVFALPGDFTIELWFYVISFSPSLASLINIGAYDSGILLRVQSGLIEAFLNSNELSPSVTISTGVWHHIAWTRSGSTTYLLLDGSVVWSGSYPGSIPAGNVLVGRSAHNSGEYLNGYIDDVRITKGVARYTGSYTVPTAAFPNTASSDSPAEGSYRLDLGYAGEVQRIVLDDDDGDLLNDLIDRVELA